MVEVLHESVIEKLDFISSFFHDDELYLLEDINALFCKECDGHLSQIDMIDDHVIPARGMPKFPPCYIYSTVIHLIFGNVFYGTWNAGDIKKPSLFKAVISYYICFCICS
jgi:hypothetical protein